jgi:hypothetical protein
MKNFLTLLCCLGITLGLDGLDHVQRKENLVDAQKLEEIFNVKPDSFPDEGVVKVNFPRTDITVTVDRWPLSPFIGLSSWVAFQKGGAEGVEAMMMGDLALLEHEVNPAMSVALDNNIAVTALHNHFFYDKPKIYFMHVSAEGTLDSMARAVVKIFDAVKSAKSSISSSSQASSAVSPKIKITNAITGSPLEKIMGASGTAKDGMFKIVIGRHAQASCGCTIGKNMGVNTWAAFGGTDDQALVDGDFVVLEDELQPVLKALRAANIEIVAIHNHMTHEKPRLIFLHYWGRGKATQLAQGLKNALDKTGTFERKHKEKKSL